MKGLKINFLINDKYIHHLKDKEIVINEFGDISSNELKRVIQNVYFKYFSKNIFIEKLDLFLKGEIGLIKFQIEIKNKNSIKQNIFENTSVIVSNKCIQLEVDEIDDYYRVLKTDEERELYRNWETLRDYRSIESFINGVKFII